MELPRDVHLVPFFVVALLVIVYILLIGPGDYFLLRRLGRGMQWTWITFPAIVVLFAVGAYLAAYWLKGDQLRVSQVDLVDIDAEGTARGASWFSIFSPRGESFDLSMRPRLPDGQPPQQASASLAWFGKAGNEFNGMYSRDTQNSAPLWSQGYSIASVAGRDPRRADPGLGLQEFHAPLAGTRPRSGAGRLAQGRRRAAFRHDRQPAERERSAGRRTASRSRTVSWPTTIGPT